MSFTKTYMLIDQYDGDILPLLRKVFERLLDSSILGLRVDDEEVFLGLWRWCDMLLLPGPFHDSQPYALYFQSL